MNIIIAGAGKVGYRLAKSLCETHNVFVIDKNEEALDKIRENIDVLTIQGNVEDPKSYEFLEKRTADIFIAVTNTDETNLIASIIVSEKVEVKRKIIRLINDFFASSSIASKIGITDVVFPFRLTAKTITGLLSYPNANNVKRFAQTSNKLISIKVEIDDRELSVYKLENEQVKIVGIDSGKKLYMPNGDMKLKQGDMVYFFGQEDKIMEISLQLNKTVMKKIENVAIFGAGLLSLEIAEALAEEGITIKLIEEDLQMCKKASETLQRNVTVINSKYNEFRLYEDERIKHSDMIIASMGNDEENIIKCIEAREHGVKKVVAINNDIEHYNLMHSLGIVVVRGPKISAFYSILEIIGSNAVTHEKLFCGGSGIMFIRELQEGKTIHPFNANGVLTCLVAENEVNVFHKKQYIEHTVNIAVFCLREKEEEVRKWIGKL